MTRTGAGLGNDTGAGLGNDTGAGLGNDSSAGLTYKVMTRVLS